MGYAIPRLVLSNRLKRRARHLRNLLIRKARLITNRVRDHRPIRHRRALAKRYHGTPETRAIAEALADVGFYFTDLRRLGVNDTVLDYCRSLTQNACSLSIEDVWSQNYDSIYHRNDKNGYWIDLYLPMRQHRTPVLDFATNDVIVGAACNYLKEVPFLTLLGLFYTPAHADRNLCGNQLWHLDGRRPSQVKVFMLPDGADEESGPLYLVPRRYSQLPRTYSQRRSYSERAGGYTDEQIIDLGGVDISKRVAFVGAPGSVLIADTSQVFHCGGRTRNAARSQVIMTWAPIESYLPHKYKQKFAMPDSHFSSVNREILARFS